MNEILVIGAGAFGTGLANALAIGGKNVRLWGRDPKIIAEIKTSGENSKYLPEVALSQNLTPVSKLNPDDQFDAILLVLPAQYTRQFLTTNIKGLPKGPLVLCAKGVEKETHLLQSDIAQEYFPDRDIAALSGPGFANEIARGLPTALTLATSAAGVNDLQQTLSTETLRLYISHDLIGVQLGGALKNVIAIACGIAIGAGLGESARAALISRGYSELSKLAEAMGGNADTMTGLSGLGDLALTATSKQSRNYNFGISVGQGRECDIETVEGKSSARAVAELGALHHVEVPISYTVAEILDGKLSIKQALSELMNRPLKLEGN